MLGWVRSTGCSCKTLEREAQLLAWYDNTTHFNPLCKYTNRFFHQQRQWNSKNLKFCWDKGVLRRAQTISIDWCIVVKKISCSEIQPSRDSNSNIPSDCHPCSHLIVHRSQKPLFLTCAQPLMKKRILPYLYSTPSPLCSCLPRRCV